MNEEPIIHAALNPDSLPKHTRKNNNKHKSSSSGLSLARKELKHHKCKKQKKNTTEDVSGKDFLSLPWRVISGVLGVLCLLLLVTAIAVYFLTANSSSKQTPLTDQQKGCHSCPKNWIWFRYSCYYFSKEQLTWRESQHACLSQNSSLMKINKEELHFFSLNSFFWIGVYHNGIDQQWLWENDSIISSDIFDLSRHQKGQVCLSYKSREAYFGDVCESKQNYICKNQLI
ncbi:killer cell lectin-like receptor subfamily E member 1 isoform X1 [Loxodonta africana]|uniref:killer cell lectin-like receptor subfamily E member 1 isoform X1 n=1 Tax=Loxodonta africana TaxID=9785 RepID=UPI0030CE43A8